MKKLFFTLLLFTVSYQLKAQKFFLGYRAGNSTIFDNIKNEDFGNFKSRLSHEVELGHTLITFKSDYNIIVGVNYSRINSELEDKKLLSEVLSLQNVKNSTYSSDNLGFFLGGSKIFKQNKISFVPTIKLKFLITDEKISNVAFINNSIKFNYFDQEIRNEKKNKIELLGKNILLLDISNPILYKIKKMNFYLEPFFTLKLSNFKNETVRYNLTNYGVGLGTFF